MSFAMVAALSRMRSGDDGGNGRRMEGERQPRREWQIREMDNQDMRRSEGGEMRYTEESTGMNSPAMRRMGGGTNGTASMTWYPPPYAQPWPMGGGEEEPDMLGDNITPIDAYRRIGFGEARRRLPARREDGRFRKPSGEMESMEGPMDHYGREEPQPMGYGGSAAMGQHSRGGGKLTRGAAAEWVESMEGESEQHPRGEVFSWETARDLAQKVGNSTSGQRMIDFYAVLNAMYSDFSAVAQRYKLDTPEFYAYMAKAWLDDPDAVKNKAYMYYQYIVDHK